MLVPTGSQASAHAMLEAVISNSATHVSASAHASAILSRQQCELCMALLFLAGITTYAHAVLRTVNNSSAMHASTKVGEALECVVNATLM